MDAFRHLPFLLYTHSDNFSTDPWTGIIALYIEIHELHEHEIHELSIIHESCLPMRKRNACIPSMANLTKLTNQFCFIYVWFMQIRI